MTLDLSSVPGEVWALIGVVITLSGVMVTQWRQRRHDITQQWRDLNAGLLQRVDDLDDEVSRLGGQVESLRGREHAYEDYILSLRVHINEGKPPPPPTYPPEIAHHNL